ncbi:hypothetical protein [Flavobacterium sp. UMI-01]|uniref:hypothetical protein n=1 Tax=Flavobacterium sp. UMI-01 TaxID=1441053 RepID=UPI001C7D45FB|nr:hypothetical protein [Flavobacterium sp. UMI-01]GIZ09206.1 hypothetical protein FUMI01_19330 [Flavobacterium sp. UMI-01]
MKKILFVFLFLISLKIIAQDKKILAIKINVVATHDKEFVGRDPYGYHYFTNNGVLYKIKGLEHWEYKNISLGSMTKIDLNNPLQIVLFYDNFNTVILLDNQLNETQKINFSENPNPIIVSAAGNAAQNKLWLYNRLNQQIGFYDYLKDTYRTISTPLTAPLLFYQTDFNHFYWIDDKKNAFVCSIYGKISNLEIPTDFDWITFINTEQYLYTKDYKLFLVNSAVHEKYEIEILEKTFEKCYYKDQILSIFTTKGITNYKIITP